MKLRLSFARMACLAGFLALGASSFAQTGYPVKPIKLIIPLAAGSAVDNAGAHPDPKNGSKHGAVVRDRKPGGRGWPDWHRTCGQGRRQMATHWAASTTAS
jgi:tripartite-type tricarboxylate transporter receptor subunit TctC